MGIWLERNRGPKRILVIKFRYIGDTLLITPLIRALKEGIPNAHIDVLVNKNTHQVLINNPYLEKSWVYDYQIAKKRFSFNLKLIVNLIRQHYNIVIDLTNNDRSSFFTFLTGARFRIGYWSKKIVRKNLFYNKIIPSVLGTIHTVDHHLKVAQELGLSIRDHHPFIAILPAEISNIDQKLYDSGLKEGEPFVIIHPGVRRWYKSWPLDRFAKLADNIIRKYNVNIILAGNEDDKANVSKIIANMKQKAINLTGQVSLLELPTLIKKALCLIGNDSAPIHIATAVETPAIALFGPTDWRCWYPRREHDRVFAAEFPCRPCGHGKPDCPLGDGYCMSHISFEEVWLGLQETISARLDMASKKAL